MNLAFQIGLKLSYFISYLEEVGELLKANFQLNELEKMDAAEFEAAKISLIADVVQSEGTLSQAAYLSILREFRQLPNNFTK